MRIAIVSGHASPLAALGEVAVGGQNRHVAELSAALVRAGHEVTVYTRRDGGHHPVEVETPQGFCVVHVPAGPARHQPEDEFLPHIGQFTRDLRRLWRDRPPDVVHSHSWTSGLAAVFAGMAEQTPIVHTFHTLGTVERRHEGMADTSPPDRIRLERLVGRSASRIIAAYTGEAGELGRMGLTGPRISVVPYGVDSDRFRPEGPRSRKQLPYRVVSAGRLAPSEGLADLIAAMAYNPDTELVIAGGPDRGRLPTDPDVRRLGDLAERYRVSDRVRLVGQVPRDRMPALLRSADLVACVPWHGWFGIVALVAMACGVPVLATTVGGLTDTVVDGVTGVLVPPRRPKVLATTMRTLLTDPVKRDFYGATARERVEARYTWDQVVRHTTRVYDLSRDPALTA
jgi:glycosyltransferase involved in cell wall biosynthesis